MEKGGLKTNGGPLLFQTGSLPHHNALSTYGILPDVAARTVILFPYDTPFHDVIGLSTPDLAHFLHFPLFDFVGLWTVGLYKSAFIYLHAI